MERALTDNALPKIKYKEREGIFLSRYQYLKVERKRDYSSAETVTKRGHVTGTYGVIVAKSRSGIGQGVAPG